MASAQSSTPSSFTAHRPLTPAVKLAPLIRTARVTECLKLDDGKHWFKITVFPKPLLHSHNRSHSTSPLSPPSTPPPSATSITHQGCNNNSSGKGESSQSPSAQLRGRSPSSAAAAAAAEAAAAAHSLPYCIWRRYEHFVDFHSALTSQIKRDTTNYHPTTADSADSASSVFNNSSSRDSLPVLPKSRFFVTRAVCEERVVRLDEYVRLLLDMDQRVTRNILVAEFFGVWPKDAGGGNESAVLNETPGESESLARGNNTQKPFITLSRKSEDNRARQDRRFNLPLPVVHKIDTRTVSSSSRPKAETLNAKSARRSGKQLKYHGAAANNNEDDDDVELDEAWLKPVQEKRRSRMILDPSFGPGLNTLLRETGARNYLTEPESSHANDSSGAASPRRPSHSHIQATPQTYMTTTVPAASPMMATSRPPVPLRKTSGSEYTPSYTNAATMSRQTSAGGALILDIPHRSHSRNWSSSGTLSPLFSTSAENQSPFFTAAAAAAASSATAPTTTTTSPSSSARTSPLRSQTTSAASSPRSADKSLPRLLQESQSLYAILGAGSASSPTLTLDDLAERAAQPVQRRRSKSSKRRPTVQSREDSAVSVNENQDMTVRPRKSSESKRAVRDREREPLTPPTSASPSPPPTFGAPAVDGTATLERGQPQPQARQVVVVNQSPTRLVAPLRAMTLTRHQSTPTMDNVGSNNTVSPGIPSPPMVSASPVPPPMSADSGYPRHPDLAPASLHRTLTDPLLMRRTPSPESSPPSALPMHLRSTSPMVGAVATAAENTTTTSTAASTPLPNIPQRKPSLLSRAKTTLSKKSPSPPPTADNQQDPDDPTIPPWNRLARSNSVKNGIIYDNPPPRDAPPMPFPATLARARTFNATPPPAETEFRIPRSFTTTSGSGGGKLPVRTNSTRAGQGPRTPRRANTLTSTTALGAHFIHLKAQHTPPAAQAPVTILLKVSRTTALGVVTARLQEKFAAVLQGENEDGRKEGAGGIKVLGLTYVDEDGCQIEVCDDEDWMVLCAAAKGKVVVGVRVGRGGR
ncbi:hypothetical protein BDZ88DRAFT_421516 [Geranomyces variabilis]|nr:hypothetical protein BDZ88DRAFT_421516 [Geranomyces variabilis]KAJ3143244.1 hypothetical protein HDU90_000001 [Geranomyces variabilis]